MVSNVNNENVTKSQHEIEVTINSPFNKEVPQHPTLVLIDGHALAYRMYFALENTQMKSKVTGEPTWAVYGFINALFSLLQTTKPDAIAVSFDVGSDTFRKEMYSEYKAHREEMPVALQQQMDRIKEGVRLLGIPIYEMRGYEADDVIGTLSTKARNAGWWVKILTGDQDSFQLVKDFDLTQAALGPIQVLIPSRIPREGLKTFDSQAVFQKLGVYPNQVIDYKGLRGDTSDNIPGIPGVGEKTAVKFLTEFKTMEGLYENLDKLPKNKMLEKLTTYQEQAVLSKQLATIDLNVPIEIRFEDCHLELPDWQALMDFFEICEFKGFQRQASTILAPFKQGSLSSASSMDTVTDSSVMNVTENDVEGNIDKEWPFSPETHAYVASTGPLKVPHQIVTSREDLKRFVERIQKLGVVAIDIETTGLDVYQCALVGIAISVANGLALETIPTKNPLGLSQYPKTIPVLKTTLDKLEDLETVYVPVQHIGEQNEGIEQLAQADILEILKPVLQSETVLKIAHNAKFEISFFEQMGYPWHGPVTDTMLASYIENPEGKHGLKALGMEKFQYQMQEIKTLIGSGKSEIPFSHVPLVPAAEYASCDSHVTLELAYYFTKRFNEDQRALLAEIEMPVAQVLADIEQAGVSLDTEYLKTLSEQLAEQLQIVEAKIHELAGVPFNINSPKQVGEILFDKLGISPGKKTKGKTGFSTDVKVLELLSGEHPIVDAILEYRQLFKLKSTYIDALPALINPKTGRLHTSFNQAVTATGRLSSSNPNLQNIPIRTDMGREIRRAFIPKDRQNWKLLSADYSQIELRLLAHFSEEPNLVQSFQNGEDIHQATAALVFGVDLNSVTKDMRYKAKAVNFGVVYGQSAHGLSQQLKIPRFEAAEFIERYFFKYKHVKSFIESVKAEARKTGCVSTICGRVRNLSEGLGSSIKTIREFSERAAFNTPLQGSAADLMKVAMIRLAKALEEKQLKSRMILQVHDELVLEVPDEELEEVQKLVEWAMTLEQPLRVPLVVDMSAGDSWLES